MGLNFCGVDLLQSESGPKVMEVNSSPGLEGIEKATGKNIARLVIEFMEKNSKPINSNKTKGRG
jgi:ribosomal protein S6--L-glutamate ligase